MGKHSVRKRCRECRITRAGTPGKPEWCDQCGGELAVIRYQQAATRKRARRG